MKKILILLYIFIFSLASANLNANAQEKIEMINDNSGVYVFKINTKKYGNKIKPYIVSDVVTPKKIYNDCCFDLVVNGGFFDVDNSKSVSYVTIDNELVADVMDHSALVENLKNEERLEKVLSRAEFRILENKRHNLKFDIAYHDAPVQKGYTIKHALQAGPLLYPSMDLVKEGFVVYEDGFVKMQAVNILKRRERTALGLKGKYLYIVIFTRDYQVDANEMRDYMVEKLKVQKAMAFDGGLSTALNYKNVSLGSMGRYQRKVKSFLVIEK